VKLRWLYFAAALDSGQLHRKSQTKFKAEVLNQALKRLGRKALPCKGLRRT
jgi:hypothetical protein